MVSRREIASPIFGIQMLECSNVRKRRGGKWILGTQEGSDVRMKVYGESEERAHIKEEASGQWHFLPEPKLTMWEGQIKLPKHSTIGTPEVSMEKCTSGTEQWTLKSAMAGQVFGFRCPPGEDDWPVAILGRSQWQSELRATVGWLQMSGRDATEFKSAGGQGAKFKSVRVTWSIAG